MNQKILLIALLVCFSINGIAQDATTNFSNLRWVESKQLDQMGALYSVKLSSTFTYVTIAIKPTKNKKRQNYWTSKNTYVISGSAKLPLLGALGNDNTFHDCTYNDGWGWNDVKKDQILYYTLLFSGRIPEGSTSFSLVDEATYGRGYSFTNYTINNPVTKAIIDESYCRSNADTYNDGICGIYEEIGGNKYRIACIKYEGSYYLIYLSSGDKYSWWFQGDTKAVLEESATLGLFKATWVMQNKTLENNAYVTFDGKVMKSYLPDGVPSESTYMKMYPTASSGSESNSGGIASGGSEWSGSGFALKNGYIVTNFHVVDGAKSILVRGVNGNASSDFAARVVATDQTNDLAIIEISDSRFTGFGTIPYSIRSQIADVGEEVWVLGYPLTQVLGNEIKLTNGVVSSRSGFQGDISTYQISAPVQPGNSGGPLFDSRGNIVGIVNAGVPGAENVGYAIKTSYLRNLADSYSLTSSLPTSNTISSLELKDQVKKVNNYVYLLLCSSVERNNSSFSNNNARKASGTSSNAGSNNSSSNRSQTSINNSQLRTETSKDFIMHVNERIQLKVTGKTVTEWESDNTNIVSVDKDGIVTGISSGKTNVWAHLNTGDIQLFTIRVE